MYLCMYLLEKYHLAQKSTLSVIVQYHFKILVLQHFRRVSSLMNVLCLLEIFINVNKLFTLLLFVYFVHVCPCRVVYMFIPFFILILLLYFCLFIYFVYYVFGVFYYHFKNTLSAVIQLISIFFGVNSTQFYTLVGKKMHIIGKFHKICAFDKIFSQIRIVLSPFCTALVEFPSQRSIFHFCSSASWGK